MKKPKDQKPSQQESPISGRLEKLVNNYQLFQISIREGMGLTHACVVSDNSIQEVSKMLGEDKEFKSYVGKLARAANMDMLRIASEFMGNNKLKAAAEAKTKAEKIAYIVLWESAGKKESVDVDVLAKCVMKYGGMDAATACGLEYDEYLDFVSEHPEVNELVKLYEKLK